MTDDIIFDDGSNLDAMQELETVDIIVEAGGKKYLYRMSSLVPADLVNVRRRVARKQVAKDEQELFLAYLALKKNHPKLKWEKFRTVIEKWQMKFIATLYTMNGMDEIFRATQPKAIGPDNNNNDDDCVDCTGDDFGPDTDDIDDEL